MLDTGIGPAGYHRQYYLDRDWRAYADIFSRIVRHSEPGPVLDLGAGCGYLVEIAGLWGVQATGLEGSPEAIELAKARVPALDIRHHRLSEPLPFGVETFQTVVLNQVIEHLESNTARHVVKEALRVLRSRGMLLITSPSCANRQEELADPTHINMLSPTQLKMLLLECGFERVVAFDSPLPVLGRTRLMRGITNAFFKLFPADRFSATANAMAFKTGVAAATGTVWPARDIALDRAES